MVSRIVDDDVIMISRSMSDAVCVRHKASLFDVLSSYDVALDA